MNPYVPRRTVVKLAIISESILISLSLLWIWALDLPFPLALESEAIYYGFLTCLPMLTFNLLVFGKLSRGGSPYPIYGEFKKTVVIPLCGDQNLLSALVLAVFSGVGEELFFRGALFSQLQMWVPTLVSAIVVSALFSYVHFIGVMRRYWQLSLFYFLFGLYFCAIVLASKNLLAPIVTHALYNFGAIVYLRYFELPRAVKSESTSTQP